MKLELEPNMYVRYISGFHHNVQDKPIVLIGKILRVDDYINLDTFFGGGVYPTEDFKKFIKVEPSFNLIDLVEVGDYVNGEKVIRIFNPTFLSMGELPYVITDKSKYEPQEIKSIVTKEQFEAMAYKVV